MTRVTVDRSRCTGIGVCESLAEHFFELNDDGELVLIAGDEPAPEYLDAVRTAVGSCPVRALALVAD